MGTSLISSSDKNVFNNVFNDIHATFGRPITIYKTAQEVVIVNNPDHSFLYQQAPTNSITSTVIQSGVFLARILHGKKEYLSAFEGGGSSRGAGGPQNQIRLAEGEVRIKLDPTGAAYLAGAERFQLDGSLFNVDTTPRPHGLFDPNFKTFYGKMVQ